MIVNNHFTPEKLYQTLQNVRVGGTVCKYTLKKCEEFTPLINEINELKALRIQIEAEKQLKEE